jgi:hypothetical protein
MLRHLKDGECIDDEYWQCPVSWMGIVPHAAPPPPPTRTTQCTDPTPKLGNCFKMPCCADEGFGCFKKAGVRYAQCKPEPANCSDTDDWLCPSSWITYAPQKPSSVHVGSQPSAVQQRHAAPSQPPWPMSSLLGVLGAVPSAHVGSPPSAVQQRHAAPSQPPWPMSSLLGVLGAVPSAHGKGKGKGNGKGQGNGNGDSFNVSVLVVVSTLLQVLLVGFMIWRCCRQV